MKIAIPAQISRAGLLNIRVELFKRGEFSFITDAGNKRHVKQHEALKYLTDNITTELAYGGAAGGAKSWTGAAWLTFSCLAYPDTMWFAGRDTLKDLRESTLLTFMKVFKRYGLQREVDWHYNGQDNFIEFIKTGSRVYFLELAHYPSDPLFERFGSREFTGGWIEEAGEITFAAYDAIKTRVNRHLNDKYKLRGKVFITLNPKKNWVHTHFWKPYKEKTLPAGIVFLAALVTDNPYIETAYIEQLHGIKDKIRKERLLFGNFDYDDDENMLMTYDTISDLFNCEHRVKRTSEKYITVDVARFGKDRGTVKVWDGYLCIERHELFHKRVTETAEFVKGVAARHNVPMSKIVVDDDGVGGGVVDILRCKGFVNGSSPLENPLLHTKQFYENLKTQCSYMAAEKVNAGVIGYANSVVNDAFKEKFTEEAEQVKRREADSDGKLKIVTKEDVKELIGRSPDDWDCFMMRMFFDLTPPKVWQFG